MRAKGLIITLGLWALSVSCQEIIDDADRYAIGFGPTVTKSIVNSVAEMSYDGSAFEVTAAYSDGPSFIPGNATNFMDRRAVSYSDGVWSYSPTEYWLPNSTYRFRAIWPAHVVSNISDNLNDNISFVYSTPDHQVDQADLMISNLKEVSTPSPVSTMSPVNLTFSHLLCNCRLRIKVSDDANAQGDVFQLTGITIAGVKKDGAYTNGTWSVNPEPSMNFYVSYPNDAFDGTLTNSDYIYVNSYGLMLIPQSLAEGNVRVTVLYNVTHNGVKSPKSVTITVPAPSNGGMWQAGNIYTYSLEMEEDYQIRFGAPEVEPWGQEQLGGTVIIR